METCVYVTITFLLWFEIFDFHIPSKTNILNIHGLLHICFFNMKLCLDFSFVFSAPLLAWRMLFSVSGIFCGGRYQPGCMGSSNQRKVLASLSLFLKSEKIRALLYLGKGPEYRPFCNFRPVLWAYRPQAQISNHRRAWVQALFPIPKVLVNLTKKT